MDDGVISILRAVGRDVAAGVAARVLGAPVSDPGELSFAEISKPHADARTVGIVRVSGVARLVDGRAEQPWSSVAKLVDFAVPGAFNSATRPENEEQVYARGHFADMGLSFRSARCYAVSHPREQLIVLWLEDLTQATGAPFSVEELAVMARHLGEWNAAVAAKPPEVGFQVSQDFQWRRWTHWNYPARVEDLQELSEHPITRALYARQPLGLAREFVAAFSQIVELSKSLPHALSFSDAPISNFFYTGRETVAVDWSGLSIDPLGADGGCFIGSALTWGRNIGEIGLHERELFESYAAGIGKPDGSEDHRTLRMAYLAHIAFYLGSIAIFPTMLAGPRAMLSREFFEKRFESPLEEIGTVASPIIDLLPSYIEEARQLLA